MKYKYRQRATNASNKLRKSIFLLRSFALLIGIIVLLEITVRAVLYISLNAHFNKHIPSPYRERMKQIHLFPAKESNWCKFDPICYYLPKEGLFRCSGGQFPYSEEKKREEIRIICIGDSTTYGDAVSYYESWPYLLEKLLKNKFPHKNIRVLNAGIPGASSRQVKRVFQFHLVKYSPNIVIWRKGSALTDSYEVPETSNIAKYLLWRCLYESRIFRVICIVTDRSKQYPYATADSVYDAIMYGLSKKESKQKFNSDFNIVKKIALEYGIRYVLAVDYVKVRSGNMYSDYFTYRDKRLSPVVNTLKSFKNARKPALIKDLFIDDCHLTEKSTSIIAREIYEFLVAEKWIE